MDELDKKLETQNCGHSIFVIRLKGHLHDSWGDWFDGFVFTHEADGTTTLTGEVIDQAALHGLLKKVRDLGLPLLSVNRLDVDRRVEKNLHPDIDPHMKSKELKLENRKYNPTLLDEVLAALAIPACVIASPVLRPWYRQWGATQTEIDKTYLGDERVPQPNMENTRAITINTPPKQVWPWLVQMGQARGGLYSYERLENLAGCEMVNADRVLPEHQELKVGDKVLLAPEGGPPPFEVIAVAPGRAILLGGSSPPTTWGFYLEPQGETATRLIIRFRQCYDPTLGNVITWRVLTDPINFVMERKMLQGIKLRAERVGAG